MEDILVHNLTTKNFYDYVLVEACIVIGSRFLEVLNKKLQKKEGQGSRGAPRTIAGGGGGGRMQHFLLRKARLRRKKGAAAGNRTRRLVEGAGESGN